MTQKSHSDCQLMSLRMPSKCPSCGKSIHVQVPSTLLQNASHYPVCHLILHGNPTHAFMVYIDAYGVVRGSEATTSIQIA